MLSPIITAIVFAILSGGIASMIVAYYRVHAERERLHQHSDIADKVACAVCCVEAAVLEELPDFSKMQGKSFVDAVTAWYESEDGKPIATQPVPLIAGTSERDDLLCSGCGHVVHDADCSFSLGNFNANYCGSCHARKSDRPIEGCRRWTEHWTGTEKLVTPEDAEQQRTQYGLNQNHPVVVGRCSECTAPTVDTGNHIPVPTHYTTCSRYINFSEAAYARHAFHDTNVVPVYQLQTGAIEAAKIASWAEVEEFS